MTARIGNEERGQYHQPMNQGIRPISPRPEVNGVSKPQFSPKPPGSLPQHHPPPPQVQMNPAINQTANQRLAVLQGLGLNVK